MDEWMGSQPSRKVLRRTTLSERSVDGGVVPINAELLVRGCARSKGQVCITHDGLYRRWSGKVWSPLCQQCARRGIEIQAKYADEHGKKARLCTRCATPAPVADFKDPLRATPFYFDCPRIDGQIFRTDNGDYKRWDGNCMQKLCQPCARLGMVVVAGYSSMDGKTNQLCGTCAHKHGTFVTLNPCVHCRRDGREDVSARFPEIEGGPPRLCSSCARRNGTHAALDPCKSCFLAGRKDVNANYPDEEGHPKKLCALCAKENGTYVVLHPCVHCRRDGREDVYAGFPDVEGVLNQLCAACAVTAGTHVYTGYTGGSYEACRFFCRLSQALGVHFPHIHYIPGGGHEGREKRGLLPNHPQMTPDSFLPDSSGESKGLVYQYHGKVAHGVLPSHPQHDTFESPLGKGTDLYACTLDKDQRYIDAGYRVFQIWGHEFTEECERKRSPRDVRKVCREWFGH